MTNNGFYGLYLDGFDRFNEFYGLYLDRFDGFDGFDGFGRFNDNTKLM